ncbi:MAG: family 10 glycosylhydrolase, partial [Bacilli bacterium]|nr:family 10 glycosylhydrolase [Bacilli bacterium]
MKNFIKFSIISLIFMFIIVVNINGEVGYTLTGLEIDGTKIYYKGTQTQVQTPDTYIDRKYDMRAVWVTPISGDVRINTEANFRSELEEVFETMKFFNLNTLIFHVRSHNDAYYPSLLNPKSTRVLNIDFNTFDPLEWVIKRCHEEGFEFHAWLNPYRATAFPASYYPDANPAKDPANTLTANDGIILNPG